MEGSAHSTEQTVSEDGVTVQQRYTDTEYDLPSVVFTLSSERAEPVTVRFAVPDMEAEKVGLHPEFRNDAWTITDEQLVFEATVEPGEEVRTLYALDRDDQSVFERAMDSLRVEEIAPLAGESGLSLDLGLDDPIGSDDEQSDTDHAIAGPPDTGDETTAGYGSGTTPEEPEWETVARGPDGETGTREPNGETGARGPDGDPTTGVSDDETPTDVDSTTGVSDDETATDVDSTTGASDDETATDSDPATGASDDKTGNTAPEDDGFGLRESPSSAGEQTATGGPALAGQSTAALVDELLDRLEDDELPPTHRERLAEQMDEGHRGADSARLASLQTRVSDIEAFTDPVGQLLDRHGPPAEVFDAFERRLAAVETLEERVRELETRVETVDDHDERIERLDERVSALDTTAEALQANITGIEADLDDIREKLEAVETSVETVREEASGAHERADEIETDLADLETQLGGLEAQLDDLAGDWETVAEEVAALQDWRSDLARTFEVFEE